MNPENFDPKRDSLLPMILGTGAVDPYPIYDLLRARAPLHYDAGGCWLASSHALVARLLDDQRLSARNPSDAALQFVDPLFYRDMITFQNGAQHERLRKLLAPLFSRKRLALLQDFIDGEIVRLLTPLAGMPRFDLVAEVARVLPVRTICNLLGFPDAAARAYLKASAGAWKLISAAHMPTGEINQAVEQTRLFLEQIESFLAQADPNETPDHPILYFHQLERDGALSHREVVLNILFLFIAGYGTTLLSIGNSVAAALRAPGVWQALRADPALIPQAVRELQRYDPAVQAVWRYAWEDVEVDGRTIPRGASVALLLGAANRDPAEFPAPDEINLARPPGRSLTFGAGPHSCMGLSLARMQMEALLRELPRRMPDLAPAATGDSLRTQRGSFHGYSQLWLTPGAAA